MTVDGIYTDVKTPVGSLNKDNIENNVKRAYKQANRVVIRITAEISESRLRYIAKKRFEKHSQLELVDFKLIGKGYLTYKRSDFE